MKRISLNLRQLEKATSPRPKEKATRSKVKGIFPRKVFRRFKFLVKSTETYSSKDGHIVSILFPTVKLIDMYVSPKGKNPHNTRVRVWCTCPAWQYWGAAYNSTNEKYNLEKKELREPNVRDPQRNYKVCKHVLAVFRNLNGIAFPRLIDRFIAGYQKKQLKKYLEAQKKLKKRSSGLFTSLLNEEQDFLDGMAPIEETFPAVEQFLKMKGWEQQKAQTFISSLTEDNYEQSLLSIGAIV